jgi:hypothetical protein
LTSSGPRLEQHEAIEARAIDHPLRERLVEEGAQRRVTCWRPRRRIIGGVRRFGQAVLSPQGSGQSGLTALHLIGEAVEAAREIDE